MIDLLRIAIPFNDSVVVSSPDGSSGLVDLKECFKRGCKVIAGQVDSILPTDARLDSSGVTIAEVSSLTTPFEKLESSWSNLAFKVYQGGENYYPHVELKASPAKLLTGHNVYGSCDVKLCVDSLITSFCFALPEMVDILDFKHASLSQIDCTFTAHLSNEQQCLDVIHLLRNVSNGQTRQSTSTFDTTAYFGKKSRHKRLKVYLKKCELLGQINKFTDLYEKTKNPIYEMRLNSLSSEQVKNFADNALRFESSILPRTLKRLAIPTNIWEFEDYSEKFDGCLIKELWVRSWSEIFKTFEGLNMSNYNDNAIRNKLRDTFKTETSKGVRYTKADNLFDFFEKIRFKGYEKVKSETPKATFNRKVKDLSLIVPKAYLQNLQNTHSNVVPLIRVINVDFERQHPAGWSEPKPLLEQFENGLRLVS